ncbi:MAG: hypothetical protein PUE18_04525 [Firmicutes bacterium]|nr:hypothetical protein [Bacillota bacterium]
MYRICHYPSVFITCSFYSEASLTHVQDLYGNLDAETQNIISKDGTFTLMEGIISDIGTGEIAFRCGFNNEGNILIEYGIEEDVFNNSSVAEKLCLYISITIDKDETNSSVFEEIEVSLPSASTIAFVALSIFFILLLINFAPTLASSLLGVLANSIVLAG